MHLTQKTSKRDVSGNIAYTPLGSTCIISTGGKITVRSLLGNQSPEPRLGLLNAYLALSTIRTMLPFNCKLLWNCCKVLYACPCSFLLPCIYTMPIVLLLLPYLPPLVSLIPFYLFTSNIVLNLVLGYTKP